MPEKPHIVTIEMKYNLVHILAAVVIICVSGPLFVRMPMRTYFATMGIANFALIASGLRIRIERE